MFYIKVLLKESTNATEMIPISLFQKERNIIGSSKLEVMQTTKMRYQIPSMKVSIVMDLPPSTSRVKIKTVLMKMLTTLIRILISHQTMNLVTLNLWLIALTVSHYPAVVMKMTAILMFQTLSAPVLLPRRWLRWLSLLLLPDTCWAMKQPQAVLNW